jgi:hypothetical protein
VLMGDQHVLVSAPIGRMACSNTTWVVREEGAVVVDMKCITLLTLLAVRAQVGVDE